MDRWMDGFGWMDVIISRNSFINHTHFRFPGSPSLFISHEVQFSVFPNNLLKTQKRRSLVLVLRAHLFFIISITSANTKKVPCMFCVYKHSTRRAVRVTLALVTATITCQVQLLLKHPKNKPL